MKKDFRLLLSSVRKVSCLFLLSVVFLCGCAGNDRYKNPSLPVEERVENLLAQMTLDEKIGQMTQIVKDNATPASVASHYLGSVLSGGGGSPSSNTPEAWRALVNGYQQAALSTRLAIPILYGTDSVHGHNNMHNATIFPHNIGLGAAGDTALVEKIGVASAEETAAAGITWTFAPCVAVLNEPRWGRAYESFGEDTGTVSELGAAFIRGFQSVPGMLTTAKHYLGDGGTTYGTSKTGRYLVDQGDTQCSEAVLRARYLPPYESAVKSGARIVMASFSSWNGTKIHANKYLLTDVLKGELGFTGFIVSDWAAIDQIDANYDKAVALSVNAGIDMCMVPNDAEKFISAMKRAVKSGVISEDRIDDAVRRILRVKFESGIFEHPYRDDSFLKTVRSENHTVLARQAAAKSVVILKNSSSVLPLAPDAHLYLCGSGAADMGKQCGGWTLSWQGSTGNITAGTTVKDALSRRYESLVYRADGHFIRPDKNGVCIVVAAENPYAEGMGDSKTLELPADDCRTYERAVKQFRTVVLVVMSGRPVILGKMNNTASAIAAVWLPGSEGGDGIADVLCGSVQPRGKLPVDWPASVAQLPFDRFMSGKQQPLYPRGYGLTW